MKLFISGETKDGTKFKVQNEKLEEKVIEKERLREFIRQGKVEVVNYSLEADKVGNIVLDRVFMLKVFEAIEKYNRRIDLVIEVLPWTSNMDTVKKKLIVLGGVLICEKENLIACHSDDNTVRIISNRGIELDSSENKIEAYPGLFSPCNVEMTHDNCYISPMEVKLENLDLSRFDTSNIVDMCNMFRYLNVEKLDISNLDTSNVRSMQGMFEGVETKQLDVLNLDTSNVTNMKNMFYGLRVNELDVSNFDTSNVTNMSGMFAMLKVNELNVSNFDTSNVTDMSGMFAHTKIGYLDISNFDTSKVKHVNGMFQIGKDNKRFEGIGKIKVKRTSDNRFMHQIKILEENGTELIWVD